MTKLSLKIISTNTRMVPEMIETSNEAESNVTMEKDVLKVIARKGVSDILYSLERGPKRFSQLMFDTKLNPSILDRHLKALIKLELVVKDSGLYRLTEAGDRVVAVIDDLLSVFK